MRDVLEILDDRCDRKSTLITSQLPVDQWHGYLGDRTVADAILDRLVHNSYRLVLKGESMRKRHGVSTSSTVPKQNHVDDNTVISDSPITASHRPGIARNRSPASAGIGRPLGRNTQDFAQVHAELSHQPDGRR